MSVLLLLALVGSSVSGAVYYRNAVEKANDRYEDILEEVYSVGAFRPSNYVGKLLTRLNEGGSETTFNTTPGTAKDSSTLTTAKIGDFAVFTINPGADNEEKVSVSAVSVSGTTATWTIINRGLSFTENAVVTANKKQHAVGETVIISNDDHYLSQQFVNVDDTQSITGLKNFSSTTPPRYDQTPPSHVAGTSVATSSEFASIAYVNATGAGSNVSATESTRGEVELATQLEMASSTLTGGSGASLALYSKYATSSPSTPGVYVPITEQTGKLSLNLLPLSSIWNFTNNLGIGTSSPYAPLSVVGQVVATNFTATSSNATSTLTNLTVTGNLTAFSKATSTVFSTAGTFTWVKPSNVNRVKVRVQGGGGGGGGVGSSGTNMAGGGGGGAYCEAWVAVSGNVTVVVGAGGTAGANTGGNGGAGGDSTFAGDFTVTAAGGSGGTGVQGGGNGGGGSGGGCTNASLAIVGRGGEQGDLIPASTELSGEGGDSHLGYGGRRATVSAGGNTGSGFGSGGSGAVGATSAQTGAVGQAGAVIVEWTE